MAYFSGLPVEPAIISSQNKGRIFSATTTSTFGFDPSVFGTTQNSASDDEGTVGGAYIPATVRRH